jgi:hypothetical protein
LRIYSTSCSLAPTQAAKYLDDLLMRYCPFTECKIQNFQTKFAISKQNLKFSFQRMHQEKVNQDADAAAEGITSSQGDEDSSSTDAEYPKFEEENEKKVSTRKR